MSTETQKVDGTAFASPQIENAWTLGYSDVIEGRKFDNPYESNDLSTAYVAGFESGHACVNDY